MKRIKYNIIDVPLEFKVACTVYRQSIQEVLQIFVDHVSMYDSLTGEYSKGFSEATMFISSYTRAKVKKTSAVRLFSNARIWLFLVSIAYSMKREIQKVA